MVYVTAELCAVRRRFIYLSGNIRKFHFNSNYSEQVSSPQ